MRYNRINTVVLLWLLASPLCYGFDTVNLERKSGLFSVIDKTVPIVTSKYIGWGENWAWAGAKIKPLTPSGQSEEPGLSHTAKIAKLDIDFTSVSKRDRNKIEWVYDWRKKTGIPSAEGFGIEFNLKLDSASFDTVAQAPELLPGNQGWRWQTPDGQTIEVKFTPALAKIYFERKKTHKIRALFFTAIEPGNEKTAMIVTTTGNSAVHGEAESNAKSVSYGKTELNRWHNDILSDAVSPLDLSFLNANDKPAGRHGYVKAKGDQLAFEDGAPARFWGANVMAFALFNTPEAEVKVHARRIAQLGFNLIRIHHHDSAWVKPNIFGDDADNTQKLSPESLKKLDWWIKCLKDEGVYVWMDLHVGRAFTGNDGIDHFDELSNVKGKKNKKKQATDTPQVKGFNYFNESIQKQMQSFNKAYLTHVNSFTGLDYKSDPAVIAFLLTNENDLTQHFGNLFKPNKGLTEHNALFSKDMKRFFESNGLNSKKGGKAWDMGEPKLFLADAEHRFNQRMIEHLQGVGVKSMIATTNSWGKMGLFGLPSLTDGDLIDVHSYGKAEEFNYNPRFNPGFLTWIGAAQVTGKPLSVTEWNIEPFPAEDRFTAPLYTASIADLQGWDALMFYGYSQAKLGGKAKGSNYSSYNDPAIMGMMPAAALLYRQQQVSPAQNNYELKLNREDFFFKKQDPVTSKSIRTLLETSRFTVTVPEAKELPWLKSSSGSSHATVVTEADKDFIPEGQTFVQSDTGELKRDWQQGIHTINAAQSQVAAGWIGGQTIKLKDVEFDIKTPKAVAAVQSVDGKALNRSKNIFITIMARAQPGDKNNLPFSSEPVSGELIIKAPEGLKLFSVNSKGEKKPADNGQYSDNAYRIHLDEKNDTHWFLLSDS